MKLRWTCSTSLEGSKYIKDNENHFWKSSRLRDKALCSQEIKKASKEVYYTCQFEFDEGQVDF